MWLKLIVLGVVLGLSAAQDLLEPRRLYRDNENEQQSISRLTDPFDGIDYRLPNTTVPLRYDVWLSTEVHSGNFDFNGRVTISITAVQNTNEIVLHYRQLTISNVDLMDSTGALLQSDVPFSSNETTEFLIITPTTPLVGGISYSVEVTFLGVLRDDDAGFYRSSYTDSSNVVHHLATTQFESTDARHGFPCYDEPGRRSIFSIAIRHHASYAAVSNMPVLSRVTDADDENYVLTTFETIPLMQTYLVAYTVSDFEYVEDLSGTVPQRVYAKPSSIAIGDGDLAVHAAVDLLQGFVDYLGHAYSLPKMDQAALPDFAAGAMENWGLVTYREAYLLFNEATGTTRSKEYVISTIAHEFAHQWFGNLVSPAWWSYLWLNEGFATLFENHLTALVYPDGRWDDTFLVETVHPMMVTDTSATIRAMTHYVESPYRIDALFDNVAYSKSGSVLRMFQHAFGHSTWAKGLNSYISSRQYNNAEPQHLYAGIQTAVNEDFAVGNRADVASVMSSWELQSGLPYITVSRSGNQLTFEQNRFMYTSQTSENLWWIPISYVVGSNPDFTDSRADFWLQPVRTTTILSTAAPKPFTENDWIVVNIQQGGYYRVNYDTNLWYLIIQQLTSNLYNQIHLFNRAQLIDDSFNLARAGVLDYGIFMGVMDYLEKETDYIPWYAMNRANTILRPWLQGTSVEFQYEEFMRKSVSALLTRLGFTAITDEPRVDRYARTIALNLGCQNNLQACLNGASQELQTMLDTGIGIHQDYQTTIYCNGLRSASDELFTAMKNKMLESTSTAERSAIQTALGCTHRPEHLLDFLNLIITETSITNAERSRIALAAVANGETSVRTIIEFTRQNAATLAGYNLVTSICNSVASRIHNTNLYSEFTSLLAELVGTYITENQRTTYTNSASNLLTWQDTYLNQFVRYFNGEMVTDAPTTAVEQITTTTEPTSTAAPTTTTAAPTTTDDGVTTTTVATTTSGAETFVLSCAVFTFSVMLKYFA